MNTRFPITTFPFTVEFCFNKSTPVINALHAYREENNSHAVNEALCFMLGARSFVLSCKRAMCAHVHLIP